MNQKWKTTCILQHVYEADSEEEAVRLMERTKIDKLGNLNTMIKGIIAVPVKKEKRLSGFLPKVKTHEQ